MFKILFSSFLVLFIVLIGFSNVISELENEEGCHSNGQPESRILNFLASMDYIGFCVLDELNISTIELEVQTARTEGNLSVIIQRECQKQSSVYECVENLVTRVRAGRCAYTVEEINQQQSILRLVTKLMNLFCYNNGNIITEFLTSNGDECLVQSSEAINICALSGFPSFEYVMNRTKVEEYCHDLSTATKCILPLFYKCKNGKPALAIKSIFEILLQDFSCDSNIFNESELKGT